ncbi:MAG: hypothetical protein ABSH50_06250 [Bryobacteraceae bacterium]
MADRSLSFWLIAGSIFALYNGLRLGRWQDLASWTRFHVTIELVAGACLLLAGIVLLVAQSPGRPLIVVSTLALAVLGVNLIAGTLLGTIPCTGGS